MNKRQPKQDAASQRRKIACDALFLVEINCVYKHDMVSRMKEEKVRDDSDDGDDD